MASLITRSVLRMGNFTNPHSVISKHFILHTSRPAVRSIRSPILRVPVDLSRGLNRPEREAEEG